MSRLGNANSRAKVIRALRRLGFTQTQGARHTIMERADGRYTTIPRHARINVLTLRSILKQCGLTEDQFLEQY